MLDGNFNTMISLFFGNFRKNDYPVIIDRFLFIKICTICTSIVILYILKIRDNNYNRFFLNYLQRFVFLLLLTVTVNSGFFRTFFAKLVNKTLIFQS